MRLRVPLILFCLLVVHPFARAGDFQWWNALAVSGPIKDDSRFLLWFDGHARLRDDGSELGVSIIRPGIGWKLTDRLALWQGYARVTGHRDGPNIEEDRSWQQATYRIGKLLGGTVSSRSRFEQRFRGDTGDDTGLRFRQLFGWNYRFNDTPYSLAFWNEIFVGINDTDWGQFSGFDQNRAFFGIGRKLTAKSRVEIGYLNNHLDGGAGSSSTNNNILITFFVGL
ncbi:MAG: DUF2490 domain-containing protein [Pseudomonadota bacterium]